MIRTDLSNFLIHWTSGIDEQEAFDALCNIIMSQEIQGNTGYIKGSYKCVCFTETPAKYFSFEKRQYKPFGIGVTKKYLFSLGGRPVIYESEEELCILPDSAKWRHVLYNPCSKPPIDFTWEREWRITGNVHLDHEAVLIVLPNENWISELHHIHENNELVRYQSDCVGYGEDLSRLPTPLSYRVVCISDLA